MSEEEKKFLKQEGTKELKKILKEVYESSQEEEINGLNDDRRSEMSQIKYSLEELDVPAKEIFAEEEAEIFFKEENGIFNIEYLPKNIYEEYSEIIVEQINNEKYFSYSRIPKTILIKNPQISFDYLKKYPSGISDVPKEIRQAYPDIVIEAFKKMNEDMVKAPYLIAETMVDYFWEVKNLEPEEIEMLNKENLIFDEETLNEMENNRFDVGNVLDHIFLDSLNLSNEGLSNEDISNYKSLIWNMCIEYPEDIVNMPNGEETECIQLDVSDYLLFLNISEENNVKIVIPSNNFEAAYIDFKDVKDKEFVQNCLDKLSPIIEGIKRYPLKSVKEILERKQHKDSEILGVISDRKVSDISKTVDEISTNIKEKTKENSSQTK